MGDIGLEYRSFYSEKTNVTSVGQLVGQMDVASVVALFSKIQQASPNLLELLSSVPVALLPDIESLVADVVARSNERSTIGNVRIKSTRTVS